MKAEWPAPPLKSGDNRWWHYLKSSPQLLHPVGPGHHAAMGRNARRAVSPSVMSIHSASQALKSARDLPLRAPLRRSPGQNLLRRRIPPPLSPATAPSRRGLKRHQPNGEDRQSVRGDRYHLKGPISPTSAVPSLGTLPTFVPNNRCKRPYQRSAGAWFPRRSYRRAMVALGSSRCVFFLPFCKIWRDSLVEMKRNFITYAPSQSPSSLKSLKPPLRKTFPLSPARKNLSERSKYCNSHPERATTRRPITKFDPNSSSYSEGYVRLLYACGKAIGHGPQPQSLNCDSRGGMSGTGGKNP